MLYSVQLGRDGPVQRIGKRGLDRDRPGAEAQMAHLGVARIDSER